MRQVMEQLLHQQRQKCAPIKLGILAIFSGHSGIQEDAIQLSKENLLVTMIEGEK